MISNVRADPSKKNRLQWIWQYIHYLFATYCSVFLFFPAAAQNMNTPIFCSDFKGESFKEVQWISYNLQEVVLLLEKTNVLAAAVDSL